MCQTKHFRFILQFDEVFLGPLPRNSSRKKSLINSLPLFSLNTIMPLAFFRSDRTDNTDFYGMLCGFPANAQSFEPIEYSRADFTGKARIFAAACDRIGCRTVVNLSPDGFKLKQDNHSRYERRCRKSSQNDQRIVKADEYQG